MLSHALREILELEQPCGLVAKLSGVRDRAPRCSSSQKQAFNLLIQHAGKLILTARQARDGRRRHPSGPDQVLRRPAAREPPVDLMKRDVYLFCPKPARLAKQSSAPPNAV